MPAGALSKTIGLTVNGPVIGGISMAAVPSALFRLPSGNKLAYDELGHVSGYPLIYFHDGGSSRLEAAFFRNSARLNAFRIIAIDRPGIGCSDFYEVQTARQFCRDVLLLADDLGISEFGVMSLGAGGVFAMTMAQLAPERVSIQLSMGGVPGKVFNETNNQSYAFSCLNELTPPLVKFMVRMKHTFFPDAPEELLARMQHYLAYTDRKTLTNPRVRKILALDQRESVRNGYRGVAQDLATCYRKLDFSVSEVKVLTMIWQGCADRLTQRSDCEYLLARMPQASFHRVSNQGHFFFIRSIDDMFMRLRAALNIEVASSHAKAA